MGEPRLSELLEFAERLAVDAGDLVPPAQAARLVSRKRDNSVVTETDHAVQARLLSAIAAAYPAHAVLAEETITSPDLHAGVGAARFCWVIDPLDGTRNFVGTFPCFATAIAVLDRGVPVVAVVREHNWKTTYSAVMGGGATLDGRRVRAVDPPDDRDVLIGVPSTKDELSVRMVRRWAATRGFILRNLGVSNVHLAMVASGALSGAFGVRAKIWDVAPGMLLVQEAGGVVTSPSGGTLTPFDLSADPERDVPFVSGAPKTYARLAESCRETDTSPP